MDKSKVEKTYKNLFLLFSTIVIYLILFLVKDFIFSFFNMPNINSYCSNIMNIEYQVLIILISLIYYFSTKNKEDYKQVFINLLIGVLTITTYFILNSIETLVLSLIGINGNSPQVIKSIFLILYSVIMLVLLILINRKSYKKDIMDIKKNHKKYFSKYVKYWFFATLIMMVSNLIIVSLNGGNIAGNEETIRETFKVAPIYILFSAIIYAPICEELVFRRSLRNIISSPIAFILTSGIIFGGLHVIGNINSWIDILYLIPYSVHGLVFAYILYKTDNVLVSTGLHLMHNGIMMSLQVLLFLLGAL